MASNFNTFLSGMSVPRVAVASWYGIPRVLRVEALSQPMPVRSICRHHGLYSVSILRSGSIQLPNARLRCTRASLGLPISPGLRQTRIEPSRVAARNRDDPPGRRTSHCRVIHPGNGGISLGLRTRCAVAGQRRATDAAGGDVAEVFAALIAAVPFVRNQTGELRESYMYTVREPARFLKRCCYRRV